jgi:hypothetical protein
MFFCIAFARWSGVSPPDEAGTLKTGAPPSLTEVSANAGKANWLLTAATSNTCEKLANLLFIILPSIRAALA